MAATVNPDEHVNPASDGLSSRERGMLIGAVCGGVTILGAAVLVGLWRRRRNQAAFHALPADRDSRPSLEAGAAVPWLTANSTPRPASFAPSASPVYPPASSYLSQLDYDSPHPYLDNVGFLPSSSPFLAPEPPSPGYSPGVPSGHTRGESSTSAPRLPHEEIPAASGSRRNPGLPLEPESLARSEVGAEGDELSRPTIPAPPPYSPKVLGVGVDLRRGG